MKKRFALPVVSVAVVGLLATLAAPALAFPTKTSSCTGCHSGANVAVTATLASTAGTNATYNFSAPNATSVVVFDGGTKLFTYLTTTGQFTVATGKTYTLYAVKGPATTDGIGSTTVSPVVVPPVVTDTTAPVTTSDAKVTYVSTAAIKLTATDAGSGVASTYFVLDGGAQSAGTSINVSTLGSHTIEFWSVDVAGNAELHKTAAFTVTAPVVVADTTAPVTTSDVKGAYVSSATIKLTASDSGSGVASTYYVLDGGTQTTGTSLSVGTLGAHTIEFWSTDVAGNVEARTLASFTITAPPVVPTTTLYTVKLRVPSDHTRGRRATLTDKVTGAKYTAIIGKKGSVTFVNVPAGTYKLTISTKKGTKTLRTVRVNAPKRETSHHDSKHNDD